ncbi:uncharacterized protein LOC122672029 [Telopea speciosissima]|uniref:uncharacterized protein LOC122672029 n=1 Tax=Telopea speciosissima TaxID=54955 RepID=UPI001CC4F0A8|nr:uncharacterized protein LOC122672029 [Telopea speciosissima]
MENTETLAEGSVALEPVKAQILVEGIVKVGSRVSNETLTGSQLLSEIPLDRVEGNGIRVSVDASGGVTSVLDKEEKDGTLGGHALGDGGSRMTAASSESQENGKEFGFARQNVKGNVTLGVDSLAVNEKDSGDQTLSREEGSSRWNGGDSAAKIKLSGEPIVVETHGSCEARRGFVI